MKPSAETAFLFFLVFARLLPMSILSPALGARLLNGRVRLVICAALSLCLLPAVPEEKVTFSLMELMHQLVIGTILGFLSSLPFYAMQSVGEWLDVNRGETIVSVLIPQFASRTSSSGRLFLLLSTLLFFLIGGHHELLSALAESFRIPDAGNPFQGIVMDFGEAEMAQVMIDRVGLVFSIAVKVSLPAVCVLWMTDIFLGYLNRLVPALQVFYLGLPVKLWLGVLILVVLLDGLVRTIVDLLELGWIFAA